MQSVREMLSEQLAMEDWDRSAVLGTSTAGCCGGSGGGSGGLVDSPGSCLSSGYCSDDAASGSHDDIFFGRHAMDCWMSSADVDPVDLLRCSLPPFDAELCSSTAINHDSVVVDSGVKFDDVVDNWLFNSMSVPSPCVDDSDWPLKPSALSTSTSEAMDDVPTDSVLADLLLNQSTYTAASTHLARPHAESDRPTSSEVGRKPETLTTTAGVSQTEASSSSWTMVSATKRTLDVESCESSAARRRRSSPCSGCRHVPEVMPSSSSSSSSSAKLHRASTVCGECSMESAKRRLSAPVSTPASTDVELSRLSAALRPEWPGFADLVASETITDAAAVCHDEDKIDSATRNSDVEEASSETASVAADSNRTVTPRPVILEALLRSSSKLDASKGSSSVAAMVLITQH